MSEENKVIELFGRVFIQGTIKAITGLHIGTSEEEINIGGVKNAVIRDSLTDYPYIPGSSLKGKMRSLMEKSYRRPQNTDLGNATIHTCKKYSDYKDCYVCQIFGTPGDAKFSQPTRLVVRDIPLQEDGIEQLGRVTDLRYSEVKWEVAIDRVTSAANPRPIERVPAGAEFGPFELVFSLYKPGDDERFGRVVDGMSLLEDDYLGGSGSRGSGKIAFQEMTVTLKRSDDYLSPQILGTYTSLNELTTALGDIKASIGNLLGGK